MIAETTFGGNTYFPYFCYIMIAKYLSNGCVDVEVRKYQTETEEFNIPNEVDMVKVMVWEGLDNIKPVSKVEIIQCGTHYRDK